MARTIEAFQMAANDLRIPRARRATGLLDQPMPYRRCAAR